MWKLLRLWKALDGWKAHVIGAATVLVGALALLDSYKHLGMGLADSIAPKDAVEMILAGLGLSALRSGVKKSGPLLPSQAQPGSPLTADPPLFPQDPSRPGA